MNKRFTNTLKFLSKTISKNDKIIDLGVVNDLSNLMISEGYNVENTGVKDLDIDYKINSCDVITSFEIFEHLFAPFNILNNNSGVLIASVPLSMWFKTAHWNDKYKRGCHYHEFEIRQFNHLLERTGWKITDSETWYNLTNTQIGIRPILRHVWPSCYIVKATK